jgi:hypothetical protein
VRFVIVAVPVAVLLVVLVKVAMRVRHAWDWLTLL